MTTLYLIVYEMPIDEFMSVLPHKLYLRSLVGIGRIFKETYIWPKIRNV